MKKIICALFLCLLAVACTKESEEFEKNCTIVGSVSDYVTGEPVSVVNVGLYYETYDSVLYDYSYNAAYEYYGYDTIYDKDLEWYELVGRTITGSDGSFKFDNLTEGEYALVIEKDGYRANLEYINVRYNNGQGVRTHLLIERLPAIVTTDRKEINFGSDKSNNTLSFNIVNSSYEDLEWSIEENCEWIKEVKPSTGLLRYGKTETIVVVIDRDKLEGGYNHSVIVVRSSNGSSEIDVYAYGEYVSLPTLETYDATNIKAYSATLNGEIINLGTPEYTERGFVYSTTSSPTIENCLAKVTVPKSGENVFSYNIKNLTLGETYYVRAYAINSRGVAYSSYDVTFKTAATLPTVSTLDVVDIDVAKGAATFRGRIDNVGEPAYTERGFVYSTMPEPTINNTNIVVDGSGIGTFSSNVSGLPKNKTIYVRAYAINEAGVAYSSSDATFTISTKLPSVSTLEVTNVDFAKGTAVFRGQIDNVGEPAYTERGFVYSTMPEPTVGDNKVVKSGSGTGSFSSSVTGLPKDKGYYVRAYAINEAGVAYGNEIIVQSEYFVLSSAKLMVQTKDLGKGDLDTARSMCENSTVAGYTDWRLPTKDELMVLYSNRKEIGGFTNDDYWSSSYGTFTGFGYNQLYTGYYYVDFYDGGLNYTAEHVRYKYVRAVRSY